MNQEITEYLLMLMNIYNHEYPVMLANIYIWF